MPEGVESETSEYLTNADEFSLWLEEHTKTDTTQTQGWKTPIPILYDSWRNFMVQCGYTTNQLDTKKTFKEKMREKGYKENRTAAARVYDHIQYLDPTETGVTLCSACMGSGRQSLEMS